MNDAGKILSIQNRVMRRLIWAQRAALVLGMQPTVKAINLAMDTVDPAAAPPT